MADGLLVALAAFAGSLVESVEALTIILAVGVTRGWRAPLHGAAAALVTLAIVAGLLGPVLLGRIPDRGLKGAVGILILLFGTRWLRKAILRSGHVIALRDEQAEYRETVEAASGTVVPRATYDWRAFGIAYQGTALEGLEVVFIAVAVGQSGGRLVLASMAALAGALVVVAAGLLLRHPLSRVPENLLKLGVGIMLSSLGTFWTIEAMGYAWPLDAAFVLVLVGLWSAACAVAIAVIRAAHERSGSASGSRHGSTAATRR